MSCTFQPFIHGRVQLLLYCNVHSFLLFETLFSPTASNISAFFSNHYVTVFLATPYFFAVAIQLWPLSVSSKAFYLLIGVTVVSLRLDVSATVIFKAHGESSRSYFHLIKNLMFLQNIPMF